MNDQPDEIFMESFQQQTFPHARRTQGDGHRAVQAQVDGHPCSRFRRADKTLPLPITGRPRPPAEAEDRHS